jgi:hypothetical protein
METKAQFLAVENVVPVDVASLYRTKWLMAHNRLNAVVHEPSASATETWSAISMNCSQPRK